MHILPLKRPVALATVHNNRHKAVVCVAVNLEVINDDDDDVLTVRVCPVAILLLCVANVQLITARQQGGEGSVFSRVC